MKVVWHKHKLIISSSVCFGYVDKYSCEIPYEYWSEWGHLSENIVSIKRNH